MVELVSFVLHAATANNAATTTRRFIYDLLGGGAIPVLGLQHAPRTPTVPGIAAGKLLCTGVKSRRRRQESRVRGAEPAGTPDCIESGRFGCVCTRRAESASRASRQDQVCERPNAINRLAAASHAAVNLSSVAELSVVALPRNPGRPQAIAVRGPTGFPVGQGRDAHNLLARLAMGGPLFPGVIGYEDTVMPQIVNAILSRHNFIILGLRGQAKSRILRSLTILLDDAIPIVAGSEVNDNPFAPISKYARELVTEAGDDTPLDVARPRHAFRREAGYAGRHDRRHHRRPRSHQGRSRRTPAVRRADDPVRHAAARQSGNLCPQRAARSRRQGAGRPVQHHAGGRRPDQRLSGPPAASTCCSASPPTRRTTRRAARSSPRSRTGSAARSSPTIRRRSISAWRSRDRKRGSDVRDGRSVCPTSSPRSSNGSPSRRAPTNESTADPACRSDCPISVLENVVSNAERRALVTGESEVVPRISDVYAALPAITGQARARVRR